MTRLAHARSALFALALTCSLTLPPAARAEEPPAEAARKARDAFTEGTNAFNLGQWDKAIDAWQRAYSY